MRNYNKKGLMIIFTIIIFILTIIFFYLLNTIKLWTFKSYNIFSLNDNAVTIFINDDIELLYDNNFFYYHTLKYNYRIDNKTKYEEGFVLTLKLEKKLKLYDNEQLVLFLNTRKNLFSLIIESWRLK